MYMDAGGLPRDAEMEKFISTLYNDTENEDPERKMLMKYIAEQKINHFIDVNVESETKSKFIINIEGTDFEKTHFW